MEQQSYVVEVVVLSGHIETEIIFVEIQTVVWCVRKAWIHMGAGEYFGLVCLCGGVHGIDRRLV